MLCHGTYCFHHSRAGQLPEVQNLVNYTAKTGVSLGACRKYENLEPMLLKEFKNPLKFRMLKVCLFLTVIFALYWSQGFVCTTMVYRAEIQLLLTSISHLKQVVCCWSSMLNPFLFRMTTTSLPFREGCWLPQVETFKYAAWNDWVFFMCMHNKRFNSVLTGTEWKIPWVFESC